MSLPLWKQKRAKQVLGAYKVGKKGAEKMQISLTYEIQFDVFELRDPLVLFERMKREAGGDFKRKGEKLLSLLSAETEREFLEREKAEG